MPVRGVLVFGGRLGVFAKGSVMGCDGDAVVSVDRVAGRRDN